jgi:uncharacterized membrane protein YhaH (DUF805 family)
LETSVSDVPPPPAPLPVDVAPDSPPPLDKPYYGASLPVAFLRFWRKYATFTGRASRSEFWWWALVWIVVSALLGTSALNGGPQAIVASVVRFAWAAATIVPFAALSWRRLHDSNLSGWWSLPYLIGTVYLNIAAAAGWVTTTPRASGAMDLGLATANLLSTAVSIFFLVLVTRNTRPNGSRFDA